MYFKRDADELESWIKEKLQTASDESYRDSTNLQVRDHTCTMMFTYRLHGKLNSMNLNTILNMFIFIFLY